MALFLSAAPGHHFSRPRICEGNEWGNEDAPSRRMPNGHTVSQLRATIARLHVARRGDGLAQRRQQRASDLTARQAGLAVTEIRRVIRAAVRPRASGQALGRGSRPDLVLADWQAGLSWQANPLVHDFRDRELRAGGIR